MNAPAMAQYIKTGSGHAFADMRLWVPIGSTASYRTRLAARPVVMHAWSFRRSYLVIWVAMFLSPSCSKVIMTASPIFKVAGSTLAGST